jgi:UDP-N-acetylglucosamine 2-epimerase
VLAPAGYLEMLLLLEGARGVFTDSGGVQKEAFILGTPCVTLRDRTEWVETVERGANVIVGADPRKIRKAGRELADRPRRRAPAALYGGGHASERIARRIASFLS